MNKIKHISLSFIFLIQFLLISSSYAEVKQNAQMPKEILTQSELIECQNQTKLLEQTAQQLNERASQLMTEKVNISELEFDRSQMYADIDFHSQASVDKYNLLNKQLKQLSQKYTEHTGSYNEAVNQYKEDIEQHLMNCDDKHYYQQ